MRSSLMPCVFCSLLALLAMAILGFEYVLSGVWFHHRLNWKDAKASALVAAGDMISCAGKGRVEVAEIDVTKKDRYAVQLVRYV